MIYVTYHLKLELSYLMDSFAMPPPHPDEKSLDLSSSGELSPEQLSADRISQPDRQPISFTLNGDENEPKESPGTEMKKNGWVFVSDDSIGGNASSQTKPCDIGQSDKSEVTDMNRKVNVDSLNTSQADLINKAVISVLNESRDRPVAESKVKDTLDQENNRNQQETSIKKETKVDSSDNESKERVHLGVTEHKTTLIIRQVPTQPSAGTNETFIDQNSAKNGSQDSLEKVSKAKTGKTAALLGVDQGGLTKGGMKQEEKVASDSPLGLPSMSQLDVEQTIMRSRSNSTNTRKLADIKRHKRSISDIPLAGNINISSSSNNTIASAASGMAEQGSISQVPPARGSKEISDFSDPLQDYQRSKDESIFYKDDIKLHTENRVAQNFKKVLGDVIVCTSPLQRIDTPYLETVHGMRCKLRNYFPPCVYWSQHFETATPDRYV